jgi:hypothetical protein
MIALLRECALEVCPTESAPWRLASINVEQEKLANWAKGDHWRLAGRTPLRSARLCSGLHVLELEAEVAG